MDAIDAIVSPLEGAIFRPDSLRPDRGSCGQRGPGTESMARLRIPNCAAPCSLRERADTDDGGLASREPVGHVIAPIPTTCAADGSARVIPAVGR
jgi:hypothetical protein